MPTRVKELRDWLGTFSKDCTVYLMNDEVWVFEEGDEEPTGTFTVEDNYG